MATFLDKDAYQAFHGFLTVEGIKDDLSNSLQSLGFTPPTPVPADQQDRAAASDAGAASPPPQPSSPSPAPQPDSTPPPDQAAAGLPAPSAPVTAPFVAPPPSPSAPVTAPLVAPQQQPANNAMLDRNGVISYVQQHAKEYGLDPAAVLAVANQEGLNTAPGSNWTVPGEGNISFGPPSWFGNGAGSAILKQQGANAAQWSWTPDGINYWLGQVATAAKGLTGQDAVSAIVHGFERPREDLATGEVNKALAQYNQFQGEGGPITTAGPTVSGQSELTAGFQGDTTSQATAQPSAPVQPDYSTAQTPADIVKTFGGHLQSLAGGATQVLGQAQQTAGDTVQTIKDDFGKSLSGILDIGKTSTPGPPIQGDYTSLLPGGTEAPGPAMSEAIQQLPVVGGIAQQPTVLQQAGTAEDIAQKYGEGIGPDGKFQAPDYSNITPEDQRTLANTQVAVGGVTGTDILNSALSDLAKYPADISGPIQDFAAKAQQAGRSASEIGGTIKRWIQENPLTSEAKTNEPAALTAPEPAAPSVPAPAGMASPAETDAIRQGAQNVLDDPTALPDDKAWAKRYLEETAAPAADVPPIQGDTNGNVIRINDIAAARKLINDTQAAQNAAPQASTGIAADLPTGGSRGPWTNVYDQALTGPETVGPEVPPPMLANQAGITPDAVQAAHDAIDKAYTEGSPEAEAAHQALNDAVATGDIRAAINVMAPVRDWKVTPTGIIRQERTGSMAGGISTEGKVALGPLVQVAMRAPAGAIEAVLRGRPQDIPAGLMGGLGSVSDATAIAMQQMRYGITWPEILTGSAGGGYGFTPGLDVLGKTPLTRAIGTGLTGLVRTHGAVADFISTIGRGTATALGNTPEQAAQAGQSWAMRNSNLGTTGQAVTATLNKLREINPALDVVGQILVPFFRVTYNAYRTGVEFSPLGIAGTATDVARARLPEALGPTLRGPYAAGSANEVSRAVTAPAARLSRNLVGLGLAGTGLALAGGGNLTGDHPTGGAPRWSIRVAGNWIPLRALGPMAEPLSQSAALYEAARDGRGDVAKIAEQTALSYKDHVGDDTWLNDIAGIVTGVQAIGTKDPREAQYQAGSLLHSFIPQFNLGNQVAQGVGLTAPKPVPTTAPRPVDRERVTSTRATERRSAPAGRR